ncbi:MAG: hypothetical protein DMD49_05520 [Gemmatimonadetes bacterium]|nr:MAG: hypothetical protein DMD49_05520 [Gemmatimonadota bacterium]
MAARHSAGACSGYRVPPLALLGAYLVKAAGRFGQSYLRASVGERVIARLRRELYAHIQGMPLACFASLHSAELMTRVVNDVNRRPRLGSQRAHPDVFLGHDFETPVW